MPRALLDAGYTPLLAAVLAERGIATPEAAALFLEGDCSLLENPLRLTDMGLAVERINSAISRRETVAVYGDYDVDGITSAVLLTDYLRSRSLRCLIYIPDRIEEGYGLNSAAIEHLKSQGAGLIITVDCGITAVEETAFARTLGIDMIITDHHECAGRLPEAAAVIDPKRPDCTYPGRDLAGVGVAFKLVCALDGNTGRMLRRYADLVAVGTVADVMPITWENRQMVKAGLDKLRLDPRPGLAALMSEAGISERKLSAMSIGFSIAPRLNAAGRLGRVMRAAELLMTPDGAQAAALAAELCEMNSLRQQLELSAWKNAMERLDGTEPDTPIVLAGEGWHQGVIGIAASRISEAFALPTVMICLDGDRGKGSCRSCGGFNIYAALAACSEYLESFGGHALAAGLNIRREMIDPFREALADYYRKNPPAGDVGLDIDFPVRDPELLSMDCVDSLELLEPCGNGNPRPRLCLMGAKIDSLTSIGGGKHLKLHISALGRVYECVYFSMTPEKLGVAPGDAADVAFFPQINEFRSRKTVQLLISDIRRHDCSSVCAHLLAGEALPPEEAADAALTRRDMARLWKSLTAGGERTLRLAALDEDLRLRMNPAKIAAGIASFHQLGLVRVRLSRGTLKVAAVLGTGKMSLSDSPLWRELGREN